MSLNVFDLFDHHQSEKNLDMLSVVIVQVTPSYVIPVHGEQGEVQCCYGVFGCVCLALTTY